MGAVLRNVTFTEASYESFIDLQDKLHQNLARRRTLASIGTHDLDTVKEGLKIIFISQKSSFFQPLKGPFKYVARAPADINFLALKQEEKMSAVQLMELYEKDNFMKQFVPIIKEKSKYPLIVDSNDIICSLPPIINGEHSKVLLLFWFKSNFFPVDHAQYQKCFYRSYWYRKGSIFRTSNSFSTSTEVVDKNEPL